MAGSLWVTTSLIDGGCWRLEECTDAFSSLSLTDTQSPDFVTLIGGPAKTKLLRELTTFIPSGQGHVHLIVEPRSCHGDTPRIFIDCELHRRQQLTRAGPQRSREIAWARERGQSEIAHLFYNRVLAPLSSVVCYFASDLGGLRGIAKLIAEQLISGLPNNRLQPDSPPRALIVVDTTTYAFDAWSAEARLYKEVDTALQEIYRDSSNAGLQKEDGDLRKLTSDVLDHFSEIRVLGLHRNLSAELRSKILRRCIASVSTSVRSARRLSQTSFKTRHAFAFLEMLLESFCNGGKQFNYIKASRAAGFSTQDFSIHLKQLLDIIPSDGCLWQTAAPLVASALLLASYPPGSHYFAPKTVFSHLYRGACEIALIEYGKLPGVHEQFITTMDDEFERMFRRLLEQETTAASLHLDTLKVLQTSLAELKSHRSCLCCLMRTPEKVLNCKHALCDVCIQTFGKPSASEKYTFAVQACPLCGSAEDASFTFIPPTAGIRLLTLDGGGVRGVVELAIIKQIYAKFSRFLIPLPELFDYVCGTSAGGLIVLGLFLMQWDPEQCLDKFERLASQTFGGPFTTLSAISQLRQTLVSYIKDGKYESHIIEAAFQTLTKRPTQMFNPLKSETKVAVTTTTAKDVLTCLFANYNGHRRPPSVGYQIVRAQKPQDDVMVHEAASSTSAAPWFFKPKVLRNLGTFQDGGLQHNNPLGIALSEYRYIWPNRGEPDFALSIGTGTNEAYTVFEPRSPVRDRTLRRLFRSFMRSTDGEKAWRDFINTVSEDQKHRYHRLNISLGGLNPDIDDVSVMKRLRHAAEEYITSSPKLLCIHQAIFASMFYLELIDLPVFDGGSYVFSGVIFCRMDMPKEGRRAFYDELRKSSYHFLLDGRPLRCVEMIPRGLPLYRKRVEFRAPAMDHNVNITLATMEASTPSHYISGLPRKVEHLVSCQRLNAPFGRINHQSFGRHLPPLPVKRKRGHLESEEVF